MNIQKISPTDVTILIHGGLIYNKPRHLIKCLGSIRNTFKSSKIIISTWDHNKHMAKSLNLFTDESFFYKDPGPSSISVFSNLTHSLRRHIVSICKPIRHIKSKYLLIIRDDLIINKDFFDKYEKYSKLISKHKLPYPLKQPILALAEGTKIEGENILSLLNIYSANFNFHTCDFLYFGLTEDLKIIFNNKLVQNLPDDNSNYFSNNKNVFFEKVKFCSKYFSPSIFTQRYIAETYPIIHFFNSNNKTKIKHSWIRNPANDALSINWHQNGCILISMGFINSIYWAKSQFLQKHLSGIIYRYSEYYWLSRNSVFLKKIPFSILHYLLLSSRLVWLFLYFIYQKKIIIKFE